ncbi:MAG: hypothetical protein M1827_007384 [Pycnora praestabilis]|nr:MAG: hypothetical protein M1827_007384 [Pycnora praestabilis]
MTAILPPIPYWIFAVIEPTSTAAGFFTALLGPESFVADQVAHAPIHPLNQNEHMLALQLGNVFLLMAFMGIGILYYTTEPKVVRNYIIVLWLGDIGHVAVTYYILGYENFMDVGNWNALAWGNIGFTTFLFISRSAYLLGLLGEDRIPSAAQRNGKKKL